MDILSSDAIHNSRTPSGHLEAFGNLYRNFALTLAARIDGPNPSPEALDYPSVDEGIREWPLLTTLSRAAWANKNGPLLKSDFE